MQVNSGTPSERSSVPLQLPLRGAASSTAPADRPYHLVDLRFFTVESSLELDIFAEKKDLDDRWKRCSPKEAGMLPQHPIAGWVTAVALLLYAETSAIAQGTDQQREACTPDVFRLCGAYAGRRSHQVEDPRRRSY